MAASGDSTYDDEGHHWTVYKRFSDFDKLRKSMVEATRAAGRGWKRSGAGISIAALPPKRWRSLSPQVVQERMAGLQAFLSHGTQATHDPAVAKMLARFLMVRC